MISPRKELVYSSAAPIFPATAQRTSTHHLDLGASWVYTCIPVRLYVLAPFKTVV